MPMKHFLPATGSGPVHHVRAPTVRHQRPPLAAAWATAVVALAGVWAPVVQAAPVLSATQGSGNLVVFDPMAGSGGWVGTLDGVLHPDTGDALPLVSVVLFQWDAAQLTLSGSFEFTAANDLASGLSGLLTGSAALADILDQGGQFAVDYSIQAGSGLFAGNTGFGLAFIHFDPLAATGDNYSESGLLLTTRVVPAPGSLPLLMAGLLGLAWATRHRGLAPSGLAARLPA